jgi:hypothetical protein
MLRASRDSGSTCRHISNGSFVSSLPRNINVESVRKLWFQKINNVRVDVSKSQHNVDRTIRDTNIIIAIALENTGHQSCKSSVGVVLR